MLRHLLSDLFLAAGVLVLILFAYIFWLLTAAYRQIRRQVQNCYRQTKNEIAYLLRASGLPDIIIRTVPEMYFV